MATGKEIVKAIKEFRGKVLVPMLIPNGLQYVVAEKQDLKEYFVRFGNDESGMNFEIREGFMYVDTLD